MTTASGFASYEETLAFNLIFNTDFDNLNLGSPLSSEIEAGKGRTHNLKHLLNQSDYHS